MKIKAIKKILFGALAASVLMLAGCGQNDDNAAGTTTGRTMNTAASTTTSITTSDTTIQGEYEAGDDGVVSDDSYEEGKDGGRMTDDRNTPAGTVTDDDWRDTDPSSVTDGGVVTDHTSLSGAEVTDEAAFASSYISTGGTVLSNKKIGWGLGKAKDDKNRPIDAVNAQNKYEALNASFLAPDGTICLTFDEGYENGYTGAILDTLKEKNVKAIFFVTYDYCKSEPELVQRMIDEGHTVGNHTYTHPSMPDISQKQVWEEVTKLHDYVKDNFGYEMTLFRFPMGEFSERCLDDLKSLGYKSVFWSFAYLDWNANEQPDKAEALAKIEDSTHSGIYLLHAVSSTNAEILPALIDFWRSKNYEIGTEIL